MLRAASGPWYFSASAASMPGIVGFLLQILAPSGFPEEDSLLRCFARRSFHDFPFAQSFTPRIGTPRRQCGYGIAFRSPEIPARDPTAPPSHDNMLSDGGWCGSGPSVAQAGTVRQGPDGFTSDETPRRPSPNAARGQDRWLRGCGGTVGSGLWEAAPWAVNVVLQRPPARAGSGSLPQPRNSGHLI
jgi:hypothetical protein